MSEYHQNPVSEAVWRWQDPPKPKDVGDPPKLRRKALIQAAVLFVIALMVGCGFDHKIPALIISLFAVWFLISGFALPKAFLATEHFGVKLGHGVGQGLTYLLLAPFFYLCFVPARCFLRLAKKDPLKIKFPSDEPTYWTPRPPVKDGEHYRKPY